jgi:hypothetical protein
MSNIDSLPAEEGAAAEAYEASDKLPAHVKVHRPNLSRPTVLSVRLSAEEHGRLQRTAAEANLPISTVIRLSALDRLSAEEQGRGGSVSDRLARLEQAVSQRPA